MVPFTKINFSYYGLFKFFYGFLRHRTGIFSPVSYNNSLEKEVLIMKRQVAKHASSALNVSARFFAAVMKLGFHSPEAPQELRK